MIYVVLRVFYCIVHSILKNKMIHGIQLKRLKQYMISFVMASYLRVTMIQDIFRGSIQFTSENQKKVANTDCPEL